MSGASFYVSSADQPTWQGYGKASQILVGNFLKSKARFQWAGNGVHDDQVLINNEVIPGSVCVWSKSTSWFSFGVGMCMSNTIVGSAMIAVLSTSKPPDP